MSKPFDGAAFGKEFGEHVLKEVKGYLTKAFLPLHEKIAALETELAEVKAKRIPYCGPWRENILSYRGHFYTHNGSVWHCNQDTLTKPTEAHTEWVLAVKCGRDAKGAR